MDIEEINANRDKFLEAVSDNVETELKKIGLKLINVNVTDITDESEYIKNLGNEAAAKARNDSKKSVAEKDRDGDIGKANAEMDSRIQVAIANAKAVDGENTSKANMAKSNATRLEIEAEANRRAVTAELVAKKSAELERANVVKATLEADELVKAEIEKAKVVIAAEAVAEEFRRKAKGEADAIFLKLEAEAKGNYEVLSKQAFGFAELVKSAGKSEDAISFLISEKLEELVGIQVKAIQNIKFDKITVWDSGSKDGSSSTSNFAQSLFKSIPPLNELFSSVGMNLPKFLGEEKKKEDVVVEAEDVKETSTEKPAKPTPKKKEEK
jgi:flotillin